MYSSSRKKIILSTMGSLILLFSATLSVILFASYREIRQQSAEMLERYVNLYSLEQQPGMNPSNDLRPGDQAFPGREPDPGELPPDVRADFQLSTFYSVSFDETGAVRAVDNGAKGLYRETELIDLARSLLEKGKSQGRLDNLSYRISSRSGYTLVAFIDDTVTDSGMRTLLRNVLFIGSAAIVVLFFLSLFMSKRIIRPLEENDRRQKQFISDASHELKTPVAVIDANAELLSRDLGENEWLSNIRYENERMEGLVRQLLDLSRAENAETPMEDLDLTRVVTGEALAFESCAYEQGKTIQTDLDEGIRITGDQNQLVQLISILLDNAIEHSSGSEIELSLKRQHHTALLRVVNEGTEIPPEKLSHLFDRFYRVDEARSSEGRHYGLGLPIAKAVAEKHGGSIGVSCKDGKVSFSVSLPLRK